MHIEEKRTVRQLGWLAARREAVACLGRDKTRALRLATVLLVLACAGLRMIVSFAVLLPGRTGDALAAVLEWTLFLLALLPLFCGILCVAVSCLQGKPVLAADLFHFYVCERHRYFLYLCGLRAFFRMGVVLACADLLVRYTAQVSASSSLFSVSAAAACGVAVLAIMLSVRFLLHAFACFYLLCVNGEEPCSFRQLNKAAQTLLEGHYLAAIMLLGSFGGWFFLGALTCGVVSAVTAFPLSFLGLAAFFDHIC